MQMQRFSIARSLRLALLALTLVLSLVAALGVANLYHARQRYENQLEQSSSLATAAANLASAGILEAEVLRDARGFTAASARRQAASAYRAAAGVASSLARSDRASAQLVREQLAAEALARDLAAHARFTAAAKPGGPLDRARSLLASLQARQQTRQSAARATAQSDSRRAIDPRRGRGVARAGRRAGADHRAGLHRCVARWTSSWRRPGRWPPGS